MKFYTAIDCFFYGEKITRKNKYDWDEWYYVFDGKSIRLVYESNEDGEIKSVVFEEHEDVFDVEDILSDQWRVIG
jgi:hypothetical protein